MKYKLSHSLNESTPSYGNRDSIIIEANSSISAGDSANSQKWTFTTNHLGTHIDTPKHFDTHGRSLTDFENEFWWFQSVQIVDVPLNEGRLIQVEDLRSYMKNETEILLIRTGYESFRTKTKYWQDNPGISYHCCAWLRKNYTNLKVIGFDFLSLTSWNFREEGKKAHLALLSNDFCNSGPICIIEDMSLVGVKDAISQLIVAPLFIEGADGGPVTVFAK